MGALRRGVPPRRARASGDGLHAAAQRARRASAGRRRDGACASSSCWATISSLHAAVVDADAGGRRAQRASPCGRPTRRRAAASTCSSTAASSATACCSMRCAKRIATCCTTTGSPRTRCGSNSIRGASTSTSIRRRPRCAFAIPAPSTSSSGTRSSARWRPAPRNSRRCPRRSGWASPRRTCRRSRRHATDRDGVRRTARRGAQPGAAWQQRSRRSRSPRGEPSAFYARLFGARDEALPRRRRCPPTIRIRWASRSRNCTASTSSRRTAPAWCWSTCTPRTSASSTSG